MHATLYLIHHTPAVFRQAVREDGGLDGQYTLRASKELPEEEGSPGTHSQIDPVDLVGLLTNYQLPVERRHIQEGANWPFIFRVDLGWL